ESAPPGDPSAPSKLTAKVVPLPPGASGADRVIRVSWKYLNDYGGVLQRDDVRFNLAVKETAIPAGAAAPAVADYPTMDEAAGRDFDPAGGNIGPSGSATLIENASYAGHSKWTDPPPTQAGRDFRVDFPGACNRRYLIRLLPKRFCFDQSDFV